MMNDSLSAAMVCGNRGGESFQHKPIGRFPELSGGDRTRFPPNGPFSRCQVLGWRIVEEIARGFDLAAGAVPGPHEGFL